MDTPDGKVVRVYKVRVTPAPFETEVWIYEEQGQGPRKQEAIYVEAVAEERFHDLLSDDPHTPEQRRPVVEILSTEDV